MINIKDKIPDVILRVLKKLQETGYESYLVGGCVRDLVLGKEPKDFDITTAALPQKVKDLFDKTIDTGLKHGTVTIVKEQYNIEVTTFKKPGKGFIPSMDIKEDLSSRDFTMNTLLFDGESIKDHFQAMQDLENKRLKAVGNAASRLIEDPLRMLRAIRFSCVYDLIIEENTWEAIRELRGLLENVAKERMREEMNKILLCGSGMQGLQYLMDTGLLESILSTTYKENMSHNKIFLLPQRLDIRLAGFLYFYCKEPKQFLEKFKYDLKTVKKVLFYLQYIEVDFKGNKYRIKKCLQHIKDTSIFLEMLIFQQALLERDTRKTVEGYNEIIKNKECFRIDQLAVNGEDIKKLGIVEGRKVGMLLHETLEKVLWEPEFNDREKILDWIIKQPL